MFYVFTFCEGIGIAPIIARYVQTVGASDVVVNAAATTGMGMLVLAGVAFVTSIDFRRFSGIAFFALIALVLDRPRLALRALHPSRDVLVADAGHLHAARADRLLSASAPAAAARRRSSCDLDLPRRDQHLPRPALALRWTPSRLTALRARARDDPRRAEKALAMARAYDAEAPPPAGDVLHEACGVTGIYAPDHDVARLAYFALYALQHRGQESAGIAVSRRRVDRSPPRDGAHLEHLRRGHPRAG